MPVKEMRRCFTFQTIVAKWVYMTSKTKIGFLFTALFTKSLSSNKSQASAFMNVKN